MVKAVVLCGGEGSRLRPLTYYFQKTMIPVGPHQKPLLEYIVRLLRHHGLNDIVFLVGYKAEQIKNYFDDGGRFNVKITYVEDNPNLKGNGGALLNAYMKGVIGRDDTVLVYYGDILSNIDLTEMMEHHYNTNAIATLALSTRYSVPVSVAELDGVRIRRIREKPNLEMYVGIGILILEGKAFNTLSQLPVGDDGLDIMSHLIPKLIEEGGNVVAYVTDAFWYDVGSTEKYEKLNHNLVETYLKHILD